MGDPLACQPPPRKKVVLAGLWNYCSNFIIQPQQRMMSRRLIAFYGIPWLTSPCRLGVSASLFLCSFSSGWATTTAFSSPPPPPALGKLQLFRFVRGRRNMLVSFFSFHSGLVLLVYKVVQAPALVLQVKRKRFAQGKDDPFPPLPPLWSKLRRNVNFLRENFSPSPCHLVTY